MKPEVLAPAGTFDALVAAVRCGADAVYLGAGKFNARQGAVNFGGDSLREATEYCHIRGVKVYLTLNTLVSDGELADALNQLRLACEAGVDAAVLELKKYEALVNMSNGTAAKLIIPTDAVNAVTNNAIFSETTGLGDTTKSAATPKKATKADPCCDK